MEPTVPSPPLSPMRLGPTPDKRTKYLFQRAVLRVVRSVPFGRSVPGYRL